MMDYPLVSIIVPCYNHAKYISETLDSILEDTYKNKELIIIDDGSKDASDEVINSWLSNNKEKLEVRYIRRPNKGLCATLNELIQLANGKYIVLVASDDLLCNNTIDERVGVLENNVDKLVLISDAEVIDENGKLHYKSIMSDFFKVDKTKYEKDEELLKQILFRFSISGAVVMINKKIYELIGPYPEDLRAEDLYFYSRAACLNKVLFYDKVVSKYRRHETNTSGNDPKLLDAIIKTYIRNFKYVPGFFMRLKVIKEIIRNIYYKYK